MKNWLKKWAVRLGVISSPSSMVSHALHPFHWEVDVPFKILCWLDFYPQYLQEAALRAEKNEGFWDRTYLEELHLRHPEQIAVENHWINRYSQWCDRYPPEEYVGQNHLKASDLHPHVHAFLGTFSEKVQLNSATAPVFNEIGCPRL